MIENFWDTMRILGRYRELKHKGYMRDVKKATMTSLGCGDKITMYVDFDGEKINRVKFSALSGVTCAVVADLLIDRILENKLTVSDVKSMSTEQFLKEIGMILPASKMKSASLPLKTLVKALDG